MKTTKMLGVFCSSWRNAVSSGLKLAVISVGASTLAFAVHAGEIKCYEYLTVGGSTTTDGVYVLTDYVPKSNTVVRAMYSSSSAASSGNGQFLYCSRLNYGANTANLNFNFAPNVSGKFRFDYYGAQTAASSSFTANRVYMLEVKAGKAYVTDVVSGSVVTLGDGLQSFTPQYKMALFQAYSYSDGKYDSWNNALHGKFYFLMIYDIEDGEEVLKHYFVPCLEGDVVKLCDIADSYKTYALTVTGGGTATVGGAVITPAGDSYVVSESGVRTLNAPSTYSQLVNFAPECVFDQTGDSASAENAHSFTGFSAYDGAGTFFKGGWWDFGATDATTNFFGAADKFSNRRTELSDGAVITNVGSVFIGGSAGSGNTMLLKGASELHAWQMIVGNSEAASQKSKLWITDGSLLSVTGMVSMSEYSSSTDSKRLSGNEVVVSNANSRLKSGAFYIERRREPYNGGIGGNSFVVTDGGSAEVKSLQMGSSFHHGISNRVEVSKGGSLKTGGIEWAYSASSDAVDPNDDRFEVLDGGVVTNTGDFVMGAYKSYRCGNLSLVVSNGTFYTANNISASFGLVRARNSKIVISGTKAVFQVGAYSYDTPLFGEYATNCTVIVENGARIRLPIDFGYSYMAACKNETIIFRTGAVYNGSIAMAGYNSTAYNGKYNSLFIESGACVTSTYFRANSYYGNVVVSNAELVVTGSGDALRCGSYPDPGSNPYNYGTNVVVALKGDSPSINVTTGNMVANASTTIKFCLPETGYADPTRPALYVKGAIAFDDSDNAIAIEGAEELAKYHKETLKCSGRYVLAEAGSITGSKWESILSAAKATLPANVSLDVKTSGSRSQLVLDVKPVGFIIIVR